VCVCVCVCVWLCVCVRACFWAMKGCLWHTLDLKSSWEVSEGMEVPWVLLDSEIARTKIPESMRARWLMLVMLRAAWRGGCAWTR
jgi:hypothetical protein